MDKNIKQKLMAKALKRLECLSMICCVAFVFTSCTKAMPGGFWEKFQSNLLVKNVTDQGPRGGTRAMYWKGKARNTFNSNVAREYASNHDWAFVDSLHFTADSIGKWKDDNNAIFPLSDTG